MANKKNSKVNPDNYIVVQGWMVTDLKLKGNALLIYAAIWGFSQGDNQFTGSLQYIADWTNSTKAAVHRVLKKLCDDGLLIKEDEVNNNVKFCKYKAIKKVNSNIQNTTPNIQSITGGNIQNITPSIQSITGGDIQSTPNNIDNNIENNLGIDNIDNKKSRTSTPKKSKPKKSVSQIFIKYAKNNEKLLSALTDFEEMRNKIKKPMTDNAKESLLKRLDKLAFDDYTKIDILNQSIFKCWQDVYPLKTDEQNYQNQNFNKKSNNFSFTDIANMEGF